MKLLSPRTDVSRPITDRVKESLFSVLYNYGLPADKCVADLFCGVGSLGLEALSRGAKFVTFVEKDQDIITTLEKNIEKAGFAKSSKVIKADAFKIGAGIDENKYELVFIDPPYRDSMDTTQGSPLYGLLALLGGQLAANGIAVVRCRQDVELSEHYGQLKKTEQRQWGTMIVTIFERCE